MIYFSRQDRQPDERSLSHDRCLHHGCLLALLCLHQSWRRMYCEICLAAYLLVPSAGHTHGKLCAWTDVTQ